MSECAHSFSENLNVDFKNICRPRSQRPVLDELQLFTDFYLKDFPFYFVLLVLDQLATTLLH